MKMQIVSLEGKKVGDINLSAEVFGCDIRTDLLHRVVNWQRAKSRQGSANTKCRSEINKTGAKLFRQKGTGNARHGSKRSNIFVGGATQFGPKPRDFGFNLNKKVKTLALKTALSSKAKDKNLIIVDSTELKTHKTKDLIAKLTKLGATRATFIVDSYNDNFDRASRNIPHIKVMPTEGANVYDILRQETLVLTTEAVKMLEGRLIQKSEVRNLKSEKKEVKAKPVAKKAPVKKSVAKKAAPKKEAK